MVNYPELWRPLVADHERTTGATADTVISLLKIIEAPDSLIALGAISTNLLTILKFLQALAAQNPKMRFPAPEQIDEWLAVCRKIAGRAQFYDSLVAGIARTESRNGRPPLHGLYDTNPLYCALYYLRIVGRRGRTHYAVLLAQFVLACYWLTINFSATEHATQKQHASLQIRKFVEGEARIGLLVRLPDAPVPIENYLDALEILSTEGDGQIVRIATLIRSAVNAEAPRTRTPGDRARKTWPALLAPATLFSVESQPTSDEEPELDAPRATVLKLAALTPTALKDWVQSGLSPDEAAAGIEFIAHENEHQQTLAGRRARDQVIRARGAASASAMDNQLLPISWRSLTSFETTIFLNGIKALADEYRDEDSVRARENVELAALLAAAFWTGRPIEQLVSTMFAEKEDLEYLGGDSGKRRPGKRKGDGCWPDIPCIYVYQEHQSYWSMIPARPVVNEVPTADAKLQAVPTTERWIMRTYGAEYAEELFEYHISGHDSCSLMFPRSLKCYMTRSGEFLRNLNEQYATRLTHGRIFTSMFRRIAVRRGSDVTFAALITGRDHPLARAPLHYTAVRRDMLQKLYVEECAAILTAVRQASPYATQSSSFFERTPRYDQGYIGAVWRPTEECVKNLQKELRKSLAEAWKIREPIAKIIGVHNAITLYTHWLVAFTTGYRAVWQAFFHETEIDENSGFAAISDKDTEDFYHARIVRLPQPVITQIAYWRRHWEIFRTRCLNRVNPGLFRSLMAEKRSYRNGEKPLVRRTRRDIRSHVEGLFVFNAAGRAFPLRPATVKRYTGAKFFLPANAGRHYLRSRLLEEKCPAEIVAAFMGHWERGEEPWGKYSAMSPQQYREALDPCLGRIIKECGWRPQRGFVR